MEAYSGLQRASSHQYGKLVSTLLAIRMNVAIWIFWLKNMMLKLPIWLQSLPHIQTTLHKQNGVSSVGVLGQNRLLLGGILILHETQQLRVSTSIQVSNKWANYPFNLYRFYRPHLFALALSCQCGRCEKGAVVLLFSFKFSAQNEAYRVYFSFTVSNVRSQTGIDWT